MSDINALDFIMPEFTGCASLHHHVKKPVFSASLH
jgi:hypothetical protein